MWHKIHEVRDLWLAFGGFYFLSFRDYLDDAGYPDVTPIWATNDSKNVTWKTEMEMSKTKIQVLRVIEKDYPFANFF